MPSTSRGRPDGRQVRWDRHNQERRRHIIDAAIACIQDGQPGADVHVQQIAERAGLSRTVVYRHFGDRGDLDHAVQVAILDDLGGQLLPSLTLDGTIEEIIRRIVSTYVGWTVEHPALHRLAEQDLPGRAGAGALQSAIAQIAQHVEELITVGAARLGGELDADDAAALDPMVFGLVGVVFGSVRRWLARPARQPAAPEMVDLLTRSVWHLIDGYARRLGLVLDPQVRVDELFAAAAAVPEAQE